MKASFRRPDRKLTLERRIHYEGTEHEVLGVSYYDSAVSVRHVSSTFWLVYALEASFSPIVMKLGQNVCLDKISAELENGSCRVKN